MSTAEAVCEKMAQGYWEKRIKHETKISTKQKPFGRYLIICLPRPENLETSIVNSNHPEPEKHKQIAKLTIKT